MVRRKTFRLQDVSSLLGALMAPFCVKKLRGSGVLGLVVAGPGSGLSEELVWGCEPAALETESLPRCPPGPVPCVRVRSSSMVR